MEHFIIIRFSVNFKKSPEFNKKLNTLFNEDRLDFRFNLFEKYCLNSIVNQTYINFKVIIIYDKNLPTKYFNRLKNITENYKFIILHEWNINCNINRNGWLKKYLSKNYPNEYIITTRMDDDDMINYNINYSIHRFIKKYNCINKIISFAGGSFINIHKNNDMFLIPCKYKSLAIYMTKIHKINDDNVYGVIHNNHNLEQRIINKPRSFIVFNHKFENDNRLERFFNKKGININDNSIYILMKTY